ncbi:MAG TPA: histidine kinase [Candidatus Saccharimonadales bacterium]|nr:histidine kinase [Candidatus Saccharimonadales bacterium]
MLDGVLRRRLTWVVLVGALAAGLLAVALRVSGPSDGARVGFYAGAWSADGVRIDPIDAPAAGLQAGDLVESVAERSLETWVQIALDPGAPRPAGGAPYGIERDGASIDVDIAWTTPAVGATLAAGWSVALLSVATAGLAAWVFRRRPDTPAATALVLAACGIAGSSVPWFLGITVSDLVLGVPFVVHALVTGPLYMLLWPAAVHLALSFPMPADVTRRHPRLIPAIYALAFGAYGALTIAFAAASPTMLEWIGTWPLAQLVVVVPALAAAATIFTVRYARTTDPADRARRRLATIGIVGSAALGLVLFMVPALLTGRPLLPEAAIGLISLPVPATLALAIVHDRLFDIEVATRRTIVYGGLTLGVLVAYLVAVAGLTIAIGPQEYAVSLLATGVAALVALPLRDGLQRGVDRLLYGQRDQPVQVMRRLGLRLEWATDPARAFPAVAETLAEALRLPYVGLEVLDELGVAVVVAEHGKRRRTVHEIPLVHGGEPVGRLVLGLRSGEPAFEAAELALLGDLARQAGAAVHAQRLRDDLSRSRARLVVAREEERRRLRRDLHDGLGPSLAAVAMRAEAASVHLPDRPDEARRDVDAIADEIRSVMADLRRLVDGLRPPSLDQVGLAEAIREQVDRLGGVGGSAPHTVITVDANPEPLPELPAAVEVAAYRIAVEAVTNAVRHARATACTVRLTADEHLELEVADDGDGVPEGPHAGTGLDSMRERAAEVGGALRIERGQPNGTIIHADLPLRPAVAP